MIRLAVLVLVGLALCAAVLASQASQHPTERAETMDPGMPGMEHAP